MKISIVTILVTLAFASVSRADGFTCRSTDGNLSVKVFDYVHSRYGTRNPAVMVVSNPKLPRGYRTLAVFSSADGTLQAISHRGEYRTYVGRVDFNSNSIHKHVFVLSDPMTNLAAVQLHIYFNYNKSRIANGGEVMGVVELVSRNGRHIYSETSCKRYLKRAAF